MFMIKPVSIQSYVVQLLVRIMLAYLLLVFVSLLGGGHGGITSAADAVRRARLSRTVASVSLSCPAKSPVFMGGLAKQICRARPLGVIFPAVLPDPGSVGLESLPLTAAEHGAVTEATETLYRYYFQAFEAWVSRSNQVMSLASAEANLLEYLNQIWILDRSLGEAELTVASARHLLPGLASSRAVPMPRVERALKGFRRTRPTRSRHPLPLEVMAGIANFIVAQGHWLMAAMVVIIFVCYLRPGEALKARKEDIVKPTGGLNPGLQVFGLIVAPQERPSEPSKTRQWDDTISLEWPAWIKDLVTMLLVTGLSTLLFDVCPRQFLIMWKSAVKALKLLPSTVPYQFRHGGASEDALVGRRSLQAIMMRGRWRSDKSVRRYTKPVQVQKLLNGLPSKLKNHCLACARGLQAIMMRQQRPIKLD